MEPHRLARIRFRAWRRGFREADLVLGGFADAHAARLDEDELDQFERLLEQNDHDLWAWILGARAPSEFEGGLLQRLRAFRPTPAAGAA